MTLYLLATLDTKGGEADYVRGLLRGWGHDVALVDCGCQGEPTVAADVSRGALFAAGGYDLAQLRQAADRGAAVAAAAESAAKLVVEHHAAGKVAGVMALGGSAGTTIGTSAMRALPLGVPKVMLSTLASGQVRHYVADKDIAMFNSVADVAGLNRISRTALANAAAALAGMAEHAGRVQASAADRPLVGATMFGVTTPAVDACRRQLEAAGYEVLVFHATGNGGQAFESLLREGQFVGVLDLTTTELADELVGGVLSAGPTRLTAAAERGVPQVVSVGALDMVNFHAFDSVPAEFRARTLYRHNANVTLMRTTAPECRELGREIGRKVSASRGPAVVLFPLRGVSAIDRAGQPFDDPAARAALLAGLRETLQGVELVELDCHINDPEFAAEAVGRLLKFAAEAKLKA